MGTGPVENLLNLTPIIYFLECQMLYRSPGYNHSIKFFIPHQLKVTIESLHVLYRGILRGMTFQLHETDFYLQGRIRQKTYQVCFRRYLQRHQVQNNNLQRTYIL